MCEEVQFEVQHQQFRYHYSNSVTEVLFKVFTTGRSVVVNGKANVHYLVDKSTCMHIRGFEIDRLHTLQQDHTHDMLPSCFTSCSWEGSQ